MKRRRIFISAGFWIGLSLSLAHPVNSWADAMPAPQLNTGDDVSLIAGDPNHFSAFAQELPETLSRMPAIDPESGLHVSEVKPGLFYVTEGVYQSAFLTTDDGVIVFDAPPSFAHKLLSAIRQHAPGKAIRYLVYSHGHHDHIGGSGVFEDIEELEIVAHEDIAESIAANGRPGILAPTETFDVSHKISFGGELVKLAPASFHSEDVDTIIYLPRQKFLIAVDSITPGEVPFMNFGATSDVGAYIAFFDTILEFDFDTILSGHVSVLGGRDDVIVAREYAHDVRETVSRGMTTFLDRFDVMFQKFNHENANLAYRATIEAVRRECAAEIIDRWKGRLSVVDVWADSHCQTMILHSIMH
ncbi:MAG: MBL fold metallo-hydrolase [Amphiplicatus sp.]|nr:MBL fold metallo-hydrolase [Amphiplicatus sp.]MCB9356946.1 MBL fold metallo-hydrolase [Calditrichota bacterium]MCB9956974.1 MBL fold metallo-hydrolase [Caulobacterales bacterium]HRX37853.1 MBL fold metallo-hydrolase [Parvularculaceae bacterium]